MVNNEGELTLLAWVSIVLVLLAQGSWMFMDARKRGHNKWLWGFLGLIHFPTYLLIYLVFVRDGGFFSRKK